jgi:hypothetical protein
VRNALSALIQRFPGTIEPANRGFPPLDSLCLILCEHRRRLAIYRRGHQYRLVADAAEELGHRMHWRKIKVEFLGGPLVALFHPRFEFDDEILGSALEY